METYGIWVVISIVILAVIALVFVFNRGIRNRRNLTPLAGLAFGFILAGLVFKDNRLAGYALIGFGILLSVIDMIIKLRGRGKNSGDDRS